MAECAVCGTDFRKVGNAKTCSSPECHAVLRQWQLERRYVKMKARRASDPAYREHLRQQCRETQKRLRQDDNYRTAQNLRIYEWRERKELVASGIVSGEDAIP